MLKCLSYLSSESLPVQTLNPFVTALTWTTAQSLFSATQAVCPQERMEPSLLELSPATLLTWSYHHCCTTLWLKPVLGTATECHIADWCGKVVDFGMCVFVSCLPGLLLGWTSEAQSRNTLSSLKPCRFHIPTANSKSGVILGTENE